MSDPFVTIVFLYQIHGMVSLHRDYSLYDLLYYMVGGGWFLLQWLHLVILFLCRHCDLFFCLDLDLCRSPNFSLHHLLQWMCVYCYWYCQWYLPSLAYGCILLHLAILLLSFLSFLQKHQCVYRVHLNVICLAYIIICKIITWYLILWRECNAIIYFFGLWDPMHRMLQSGSLLMLFWSYQQVHSVLHH